MIMIKHDYIILKKNVKNYIVILYARNYSCDVCQMKTIIGKKRLGWNDEKLKHHRKTENVEKEQTEKVDWLRDLELKTSDKTVLVKDACSQ